MKETKFKQTEVGMIPSDWDVKKIGELCFITTGSQNTQDHKEDGKYPFFVRSQEVERIDKYIFDTEGVVTAGDGVGTGKIFHYVNGRFGLHQRCYLMYEFDRSISAKYFYWIFSVNFYDRVHSMTAKSSVDSVRREMIADMPIALPPIKEQQRIANALSDVDTLIANLEKLIVKKKNIKQGAMQELLTGKKRLPGFGSDERRMECHSERSAKREESSGYKMTELGMTPSDWEVKTFGELFDMCTANIPIKDVNQEFYVGTENMLQNKMGVVKNTAVLPYSKVREYQKNDILVSNIRPYLKKIWFADKNGGCSTDVLVFRVKDKNQSPSFLYNVVADDRFFNIVNENAIGTKMPRGDKNVIKQILFAVPSSKAEQTAIANVLSDMDTEISALETKLAKYRTLKTGMMQQLLTGKVRLI